MSTARRQPRSGGRAGPHDSGEETQMWKQSFPQIQQLGVAEAKAKLLRDRIVDLEIRMQERLVANESKSTHCCSLVYIDMFRTSGRGF